MRGAKNAYGLLRNGIVMSSENDEDQDLILNIRFVHNLFGVVGRFHMDYQLVLFC